MAQTLRPLSDAALVIRVQAFGESDLPWVPAVPLSALVAADEHDSLSVAVEGKQDPDAAAHAHFLQRLAATAKNRRSDGIPMIAKRHAQRDDLGICDPTPLFFALSGRTSSAVT
jgi:hypothetical protein